MTDQWLKKWNDRYKDVEYAYGEDPNNYLKECLKNLDPGAILFPAEGEGRNAVYAAGLGWQVEAFDISEEGQRKALRLAEKMGTTINYQVGELPLLEYSQEQFDVVALVYAHFPPEIRSNIHKLLDGYLRKGGYVILEAFSRKHLDYSQKDPAVGGPKDMESLFSIEEVLSDFEDYEPIELVEKEVELNEGFGHVGKGAVIRFFGRKK
ncbi:MAG: class I SAM-dependent methyltransferase [Cytophagales bacterium]|nr:class I SAM-dependent methyltransferase [Cytophagales bacterium]